MIADAHPVSAAPMGVMVLAAGRGERMRPLTDSVPKPLLPVKGKALLAWHLESLAREGFCHVTINIAHLGEQIRAFAGDGTRFGLRIRYAPEPEHALETAGGIVAARPWEDDHGRNLDDRFLAINADVWTDWPLREAFHIREAMRESRAPRPLCHLVLVRNPTHHPQGDFSLETDSRLVRPRTPDNSLTFSGLGVYDRQMFAPIVPGTRLALAPMLHEVVAAGRCSGSVHRGIWSDVGTPERLAQLNATAGETRGTP
jgi:MurNAc alpha-1-phosphate uridylyltransferase